ncbi:MAG TPA: preprotein translocase subunit YajC [Pyrinomonadaceae bacterium]|jgi:preprotein translocase subunit YajC
MSILFIFLQGGGDLLRGLMPFLLIFVVFYLLLIRPQQKRQRELQETIKALQPGDRVITSGGIIGTITAVRDQSLVIRSADKSILEVTRSAIAGLQAEEEAKP